MAKKNNWKIGVLGCGAVGSRLANFVTTGLKSPCRLTALYDVDVDRAKSLAKKLAIPHAVCPSFSAFLKKSNFIIEAVNANNARALIEKILIAKKHLLVMSVGQMLHSKKIFDIVEQNQLSLLVPSGAIAGVDALKSASHKQIERITLTTRKPPKGLAGNPYFEQKGIDLTKIKKETVVFDGNVKQAVKNFPRNINVAATIALASRKPARMRVRIITSPEFKTNSHELEVVGDFGRFVTRTENVACPDNPKTSYLAVLSGMQTLKQFFENSYLGT
ncbi:MAG: DUF108 domain-containing protein [Candidatus Omnitrophica bacterium]|nr:DUF108 domain-containing protein [Candidatus Omnitrophota bacterium]